MLTLPSYQNLIKLLGENVPHSEIEKLIEEVDQDGDDSRSLSRIDVLSDQRARACDRAVDPQRLRNWIGLDCTHQHQSSRLQRG